MPPQDGRRHARSVRPQESARSMRPIRARLSKGLQRKPIPPAASARAHLLLTQPRWIFTVISLLPSWWATCLFHQPDRNQRHDLALAGGELALGGQRSRSRSSACETASSISWSRNGLISRSPRRRRRASTPSPRRNAPRPNADRTGRRGSLSRPAGNPPACPRQSPGGRRFRTAIPSPAPEEW
jgi:hypothetical protein